MWGRANRREAGILFGEQADDGLDRLLGEHVITKTGAQFGFDEITRIKTELIGVTSAE